MWYALPRQHSARAALCLGPRLTECCALLPTSDALRTGRMASRALVACALAVVAGGEPRFLEGFCEGEIGPAPRGEGGFGYDPLFVADATPDGRTNGELLPAEKDAISHRGNALKGLPSALEALL